MTKASDRKGIERLLDMSRWKENKAEAQVYRNLADAMAKDYAEIHGEKYVEGGKCRQ